MPRQRDDSFDDDVDEFDPDAPDESEWDDEDTDHDTYPCPFCKAEVFEGADICPKCGNFVSPDDALAKKPRWIPITAISLISLFVIVLAVWHFHLY